jgi:hypothetical protein
MIRFYGGKNNIIIFQNNCHVKNLVDFVIPWSDIDYTVYVSTIEYSGLMGLTTWRQTKGIGRICFDLGRATPQFAFYSLGRNERDSTEAKDVFITISECSKPSSRTAWWPILLRAYSSSASPSQAN